MKRRYYIYFSLGVIAVFLLQFQYIGSLYKNFLLNEEQNIEESIYEAIDLELHHRSVKRQNPVANVEYNQNTSKRSRIEIDELPEEIRRGMQAFLKNQQTPTEKWSDVRALMDDGIIRSSGDIQTQLEQDRLREQGEILNVRVLDSIFKSRLNRSYRTKVCLVDSETQEVCMEQGVNEYNHITRRFPIGIENTQYLIASVEIVPSYFIICSVVILILSLLTVSISLFALVYLITNLRRKANSLRNREIKINGIIHDLKSPVVSIYSMLDYFMMIESNEDKREMIKDNQRRITLLSSRVERLLNASKDRVDIIKEPFSMMQLRERVSILTSDLMRRYSSKSVEIIIKMHEQHDIKIVNIDSVCFDDVVINLVENAIKYSDQTIKIVIKLDLDGELLYFTVEDNGWGIAESEHRKIFEHLYRIHRDNTRGYGIGLASTRAAARVHGGDVILLSSVIDKGSVFEVKLKID